MTLPTMLMKEMYAKKYEREQRNMHNYKGLNDLQLETVLEVKNDSNDVTFFATRGGINREWRHSTAGKRINN